MGFVSEATSKVPPNAPTMKGLLTFLVLLAVLFISSCTPSADTTTLEWPQVTQENKPWTRWWWMGNAVDEANLTRSLEMYSDIGLGGVEITPIYGVKGQEEQFVAYLSPEWMDRFEYTLSEAARLGLGVDMATGTGWPFGGPHVEAGHASRYVAYRSYSLEGGEQLKQPVHYMQEPIVRAVSSRLEIAELVEPIRDNENLQSLALDQVRFPKPLPLLVLMAYSEDGEVVDITAHVGDDGMLGWTPPEGTWTLYAVFQGWHGKMVERAAPGGEGYAINHFSEQALKNYLVPFNEAFDGRDISGLRGFFNDSYEVDDASGEADWTPAFFEAFETRRGYDLRLHLPALFGKDTDEMNSRVRTDYRLTLSDLLLDQFTEPWTAWAHDKGAITRNQAHGSPANILDLYAATDIPETESTDMMRIKAASSAAHVTGKKLTAAEAATWLNEHFQSNWADVKIALDRFFLGGVNHIVYHGTAYSPADAPWPGWLFYAAVHFSPQNPLWEDFGTLNAYVTRCQSVLQAGKPDNDVLLYQPLLDRFSMRDPNMLVHFHGLEPFDGMQVAADAELMLEHGYAFDLISDRQLQATSSADGMIDAAESIYKTVVVPAVRLMPLASLEKLVALAEEGGAIIFHHQLPEDVPGLSDLANRQAAFQEAIGRFRFEPGGTSGVQVAPVGRGVFLLGDDLDALLMEAGVRRETMTDDELEFIRRRRTDGTDYFIANWGNEEVNGWVPINTMGQSVALFNPMTESIGLAQARKRVSGGMEVYMQLPPGETMIVRVYDTVVEGDRHNYYKPSGDTQPLSGPWTVQFINGGPELPATTELDQLESWTVFAGQAGNSFAGTATYSISFPMPEGDADAFLLDLGEVHETARIRLNGTPLETRIGPTYRVMINVSQLQEHNELKIDVSSLMANRIAAMDREGIVWKTFYNINFPARFPENRNADNLFVASGWTPQSSGLIGPVTLTPTRRSVP